MNIAMQRRITPEILDYLPASDPEAIQSRRDLAGINRLMGHVHLWTRILTTTAAKIPKDRPVRIVDLGAGDGSLGWRAARSAGNIRSDVHWVAVDRHPFRCPQAEALYRRLGWRLEIIEADVMEWLGSGGESVADLMICNLFLHHFEEARLRMLLAMASRRCDRFVGLEPLRSHFTLACSYCLGFLGCNRVTRHDAPVSVRAGFRAGEMARMWPATGWCLNDRRFGLFSQILTACRNHHSFDFR